MHLFYAERLDDIGGILGKEESHHAFRVLRLTDGEEILTTEGKGIIYKAKITSISKSVLEFQNISIFSKAERTNYLHIAIAPTKSLDRFETFLEKATEIGVDEITPIFSFHSERKVYKIERGRKVIMAAAKQSMSNWFPILNEPIPFSNFVAKNDTDHKFIAHCEAEKHREDLTNNIPKSGKTIVLIGPEGDFSSEEIDAALKSKYKAVSLGTKRLRTETAGIVAAVAVKILS